MRKVTVLAVLLFSLSPAIAGAADEDAYVACVVGNAVVALHNGQLVDDAQASAAKKCEPLYPYGPGDEEEGMADFLYHLIWDISASSMLPPQPKAN